MLCVKYVHFWNLINNEVKKIKRKMHNILLPLPQCFKFDRPTPRYKENGCVKSEKKTGRFVLLCSVMFTFIEAKLKESDYKLSGRLISNLVYF